MSRLNDFTVNISTATVASTAVTFGNILIFTPDVDHPYEIYTSLAGVKADFADSTDTYKLAAAIFGQSPAPTQVAVLGESTVLTSEMTTALSAAINEDWFALVCTDNANATITALSTWAMGNGKYYAATTQDLTLFATVKDRNTLLQFHSETGAYLAESLLTYLLVRPIGSATGKFKKLNGIAESVITDTQLAALHANNGGTYIKDMGVLQVTNAKAGDGEYFDVVLGAAWIKSTMESGLRTLALTNEKIPYSNAGIAMLLNIVKNTIDEAARNNIIALDDDGNAIYSLSYKKREEVSAADRAARRYNSVSWTADLAGAIETATISGKLEA